MKQEKKGRRLVKYWDDFFAQYRYKLEVYIMGNNDINWSGPEIVFDGDEEWANRMSEHYRLDIEHEREIR